MPHSPTMGPRNLFLLKTLLLLWIFCAVVCEHRKRDVHHRIIIQERIPSSQKKSQHNHHYGREHSHGQSGNSRGHGRKNKGSKKHSGGKEGISFEQVGDSLSRENSFEDPFHKSPNSYHPKKPLHMRPPSTTEYVVNNQEPYRDNSRLNYHNGWIPMSSEQLQQSSQETYGESHKKRKNSKNKNKYSNALKPPPVELTTSYPFQYDASSVYPQLNSYSNFHVNKKFIESNHSPLIDTIEQSKNEFADLQDAPDRLRNHKTSYEAIELVPAGSNIKTFISIPHDLVFSKEESALNEHFTQMDEAKSTHKLNKNRGRLTHSS